MAENIKAKGVAAGLSPSEQKRIDDFYKALTVHKELSNLPQDAANARYKKLTSGEQADLVKNFGNEDPAVKQQRGLLGTAWHYTGGAIASSIGTTFSKTIAGLQEVSDVSTRAFRTLQIAGEQGLDIGTSWDVANDKGDKVFSPNRIIDAKVKWGNDAVDIAMRIASGEKPEVIMKSATPEQIKYLQLADPTNKLIAGIPEGDVAAARANFQDTLDSVNASKYSPGRFVANAILPGELEGSGFFYKALSGTVDAAYRLFADPTLLAGKAKRLYDVNQYALEVVVGNGRVADVFAKPQVAQFWNQYGAKLNELTQAQKAKNPIAIAKAKDDLKVLAPELGPAVIKEFQKPQVPVIDALTAKAFFENTKQLKEMFTGNIGLQRVLIPRMDTARKLRIAAVTTGNKVLNLKQVGPGLVDDTFFGGATTADGIAEVFINGQKQIVQNVNDATNFKGIARFSMKYVNFRIDRAKAKFTLAPVFKDDIFDVMDKDAAEKIYRLAVLVLPRRESRIFAEAFDAIEEVGKRKDVYYGLWSTIAEVRGLNTTLPGQAITRYLTGKGNTIHSVSSADDAFANKGAIPSDFNNFVSVPSLGDLDIAAARNTISQKFIGVANSDLASKATSAWSFLTLAGPRYALRNAGEDLMVNLAIGVSPWGMAKSRMLSTRVNTYLAAAQKLENGTTNWANNPLGLAMRLINRKEIDATTAKLTQIEKTFNASKERIATINKELKAVDKNAPAYKVLKDELDTLSKEVSGGMVKQARQVFAETLTSGRLNRFRASVGMKPMNSKEIELLQEQIKYGDIENAVSVASEGGMNFVTGNDYITRATNLARQTGTRVHALNIVAPKTAFVKKPGERGYALQAVSPQDEASMVTWMMRIGYYSNDRLGRIAVANLDNEKEAIKRMTDWIMTTKGGSQFLKDARLSNDLDATSIARVAFARAKENFVKKDGTTLNLDLLNKIRVQDENGVWKVTGSLSLDDLPVNPFDVPNVIVGPTLIPAVEANQITSNIMTNGWTFLGLANARLSRQPIVFENMLDIRKQMRKTGFEDSWISSYTKGIDPTNTGGIAAATERAKRDLAMVVEERAVSQTLAYVDNPLIRTQLAFSVRNFARFYRATEDFYRRMYRVVRYNPEAIVKAGLTYEGITHSGWIQEDDQGQPYFVYPGIAPVYNAVNDTLERMGIDKEFKVPFPVEFGAQLKMITPSLNPDSLVPTFSGPLAGISIGTVTQLVNIFSPGAADTIKGYTLGKYSVDQPFLSAVLPAHINRLYAAMNQDDRNSQYASAWRKAVTYLEAGGHGLPKNRDAEGNLIPPTPAEQEAYRLAIKNTTLSILGMRFAFGFFAPASPQVTLKSDMAQWISDNGRANFKQTWNKLLDQYPGDYDGAMAKWVELYPNQIPFTIAESEKKSIAMIRYADEAGYFVDQNKELFKNYPLSANFLIPHKSGFSWDAYKTMKDAGLMQNKRVDDYLREVQTAADLQDYYKRKDEFEAGLDNSGADFERTELRKEFDAWKTLFFAGRPMVKEELSQGSKTAIKRLNTLDELNYMLAQYFNIRPKTEAKLREMSAVYQAYKDERANFDEIGGSRKLMDQLKADTAQKLSELGAFNENTQAAYDVLFARLLGE